ncbi:rod shape-determining protein RodA [Nocardioides marmoribigeumensis]|uniref:peptidoglycan glycosyltransferase n=1 Tax=Nocardioides marmoribigeumensis TaxID=433649 RepID=A0ABU2C0R6_9ACTN|nr:rod shape-determining protein RodA [Nocardioides marmoribigeumensis]MDR7364231.1 rod shape determining protein RodA [Nocardioides marmoribigeumensis]
MSTLAPTRLRAAARTESSWARVPRVDWPLLLATAALLVIGTLLVWSATAQRDTLTEGDPQAYLRRHLVNIAIGIVLAVLVAATDHRWVRILAPVLYAGSLVGLALVFVMGSTINGSRSWIVLGGMSIQPSEFAKLSVVVMMALVVAERTEGSWRQREVRHLDVVGMLAVAALPAAMILLQPDLGTVLVLTATVFGVIAASGAPRRWLGGLAVGGIAVATVAVVGGVLKPYQIDRFMAFTNPALDPRGAGYNTEQARIAIGNGGIFGQGLFHGSQTRAGFVPEQQTDFIFTVAGEELGLLGAGLLILLLAVVIRRALSISLHSEDLFGRLVAAGIACWFGFQAFQNIGMCLGIMPVTGVPLPLVSYGGTSMFASLMAVGLLHNIHARNQRSLGLGVSSTYQSRSRY